MRFCAHEAGDGRLTGIQGITNQLCIKHGLQEHRDAREPEQSQPILNECGRTEQPPGQASFIELPLVKTP